MDFVLLAADSRGIVRSNICGRSGESMVTVRTYLAHWASLRYPEIAEAILSQECYGGPKKLFIYSDVMPKRPRDVIRRWDRMYLAHCRRTVARKEAAR